MNTQAEVHDWVERYVREVGRHLPRGLRADVGAELCSLLRDSIEERAARAGKAPSEEMALQSLAELGEPESVAARYAPAPGHLIGPRLFPSFLFFARITLASVACWLVLWYTIATVSGPRAAAHVPEMFRPANLTGLAWEFAKLSFLNLGLLVAVFTALERVLKPGPERSRTWDPRSLPAIEDRDLVDRGSHFFKIHAIVLLCVVLFGGVLLYLTLAGAALPTVDDSWWAEQGWNAPVALLELARTGLGFLGRVIHWILVVCLLWTMIDAFARFYRILRRSAWWMDRSELPMTSNPDEG